MLERTHREHYNIINDYFWKWVEKNIQNVAYGVKIQQSAKDVPQIMHQWSKINKKNKSSNAHPTLSIKAIFNNKNEATTFWMPGYKRKAKNNQSITEYRLSLLIKKLFCTFCARPSLCNSTVDPDFRSCSQCGALACIDCAPLSPQQQQQLQTQTANKMLSFCSTFICYGCKYHPFYKNRNEKVV